MPYSRLLFIGLITLIFLGCNNDKKPLRFVLCIGQSNMAGRAPIPAEDTVTLHHVYLFNDKDEWEPAKNPLNRYSTIRKELSMQRLGPAWSFSKAFLDMYTEKTIGLVVNVRGGTSIDSWNKGSFYYNEALIKALKAQKSGKIIGIIWHQGEADRNKADGYTKKFLDMIDNFRKDLGAPDLPVVVGEIGNWRGNSEAINEQIRAIPQEVPYAACVRAEGLMHMGDSLHFSAAAQHELGERYAEKMIHLLKTKHNK